MKKRSKFEPKAEGGSDVGSSDVVAAISGVRLSLADCRELTFSSLAEAGIYMRQLGMLDLAAI